MRGSETEIHGNTELPSAPLHKSGALPNNSRIFENSVLFGRREAGSVLSMWSVQLGSQMLFIASLSLIWNKALDMDFNSVRVQPAPQLFRHDGLNPSAPVLNMLPTF